MARSEHCECVDGHFTCGYCLRHAKPWHYTLSSGYAIVGGLGFSVQSSLSQETKS